MALVSLACTTRVDAPVTSRDAAADPLSRSSDAGPRSCRIREDAFVDAGLDGGAPCGDVPKTIIHETCVGGICHHAGKAPAAHLDLLSPCAADRLVGIPSTCDGRLLVDPVAPERSFILEKLGNAAPECGGKQMPYDNHLPATELDCMRRWVYQIARTPP